MLLSPYPKRTSVLFNSAFGECTRSGQIGVVLDYGNDRDESGVAHWIKFADGHTMAAYPRELTPTTVN